MAISELQMALVGAGAAAVAGVWAYNSWQEYRVRKTAERLFTSDQADVLVEPDIGTGDSPMAFAREAPEVPAETSAPMHERIEPVFTSPESADELSDAEAAIAVTAMEASAVDVPEEAIAVAPAMFIPEPPAEALLDPVIEWSLALPIEQRLNALPATAHDAASSKRLRWVGWDNQSSEWVEVDNGASPELSHLHVAIQLADRQGAIERDELDAFAEFACSMGASIPSVDTRNEVVAHARALDDLCASLDIRIAIHVVGRASPSFAGTKMRGVLEAVGLPFAEGRFHCIDEIGNSLFSVCHDGTADFAPEQLRGAIADATFWLDVPRVSDGAAAFDRMLAIARQLADAVDGALVDDQRNPLSEQALAGIRAKIVELQGQMTAHGIPAGGRRALRLFD